MIEKEKCVASIATSLTSTSRWRAGLDEKYPDHRNARSAKQLSKLASEAPNLSDEDWKKLERHFNSAHWHEALRQTARLVGFAHSKMSLGYFVRRLVGLLSEPATAA